jgi:hypothetical protein
VGLKTEIMRIPKKYVVNEPKPESGTTRVVRHYAWLPKEIGSTIIWLEYFEILQVFTYFEYRILHEGKPQLARVGEWKDLESRLIT